jgi:hypothetical protein
VGRAIAGGSRATEQTMRVRIARDRAAPHPRAQPTIKTLEAEIADLVATIAPHLLTEPASAR